MGICGGGRKEQAVIPIQVSEDFRNSYKDVDEDHDGEIPYDECRLLMLKLS